MKDNKIKQWLAAIFSVICLAAVAAVFWFQDMRYSKPTPQPAGYHAKPLGTSLTVNFIKLAKKPILLHFFNPECPCSKFNTTHLRELAQSYGSNIEIVAIVQAETAQEAAEGYAKTGLNFPFIFDQNGAIADSCGVYSTPQAVLLNSQHKIFYRGNYNTTRYCTDPRTEFVRIALDSVLAGKSVPLFSAKATTAYGCELPSNLDKTLFPVY